jgi:nucleotide-binding universal stress UspA family protein
MLRVLFCVDGSAGADRALEWGGAWLKHGAVQAVVLQVIPQADDRLKHYERLHEDELLEIERLFGHEGHGLDAALQARDRLKQAGLEADRKVRRGDPATEILAEIREGGYGLVVLASDGTGRREDPTLGSVAEEVVRAAPASVLVVRSA